MYVDESGDPGLSNSPSKYFALTGLVVHELRWHLCLDRIIRFRKRMRNHFGLHLDEEIHASSMVSKPKKLRRIKRNDRLTIIRSFANELGLMSDISLINIMVDKTNKVAPYDALVQAWKVLVQRFENTISNRNFPGPTNPDERGMIFPDNSSNKKLRQLLRQMRRYNPVPHQPSFGYGYRNLTVSSIVEDPNFRESSHSYFVQAVDLAAFLLYQHFCPNSYMRKKSGKKYFEKFDPILCRVASRNDPKGIVWL
jgi:hypothetical protein